MSFHDKIKVHTASSGTQYVQTIDLLFSPEEKQALYEEVMNQDTQEMSEETAYIARCPHCERVVMAIVDDPKRKRQTFKELDECLKEGFRIESVSVDYFRSKECQFRCKCGAGFDSCLKEYS